MHGILALDIDGTITNQAHVLPEPVARRLESYAHQGWQLIFVTGRSFDWAERLLKAVAVPYFLGVQNGALLIQMPKKKVINRKLLDFSLIPEIDRILPASGIDYALYAGLDGEDSVYYRRQRYHHEILNYLDARAKLLGEKWIPVADFDHLPIKQFASFKWIGKEPDLKKIITLLEDKLHMHIPLIRDPLDPSYSVAQATHAEANKGSALKYWMDTHPLSRPVIAAGDDFNDLPMLTLADTKIVMSGAPKELLEIADIVAPSAAEQGIIAALEKAISHSSP